MLDLGVILIHDAAGADVHVTDFGIAHLQRRQPHPFFGSINDGVRAGFPEHVPVRFARLADGVVIAVLTVSEAVEDDQ